jgi:glutathione S-transferase
MILIGRYASPFVRRVAVSMNLLGVPFEHKSLSTADDVSAIKAYNPMAKVPALVLNDGEILLDSAAILDSLCDMTTGQKLLPASGAARRHILQQASIMTNALDKSIQYVYEPRKRPPEKVHQPFLDGIVEQVSAGVAMLEQIAKRGDIPGDQAINLGGVTVAVGWRFLNRIMPKVITPDLFPNLAAYSKACEASPAFANCQPEA